MFVILLEIYFNDYSRESPSPAGRNEAVRDNAEDIPLLVVAVIHGPVLAAAGVRRPLSSVTVAVLPRGESTRSFPRPIIYAVVGRFFLNFRVIRMPFICRF